MWCKSTKFVYEFCGLDPLGILALVDIATLSCFNHDFLWIFTQTPCLFNGKYSSRKYFMNLRKKFFNKDIYVRLVAISINYHGRNLGYNLLLSRAFRWESLWWWDLGHNLLLSQAFRWESLWRWDLGHNLLLSQAFQWESLWQWDLGFNGASGYHKALSQTLRLSWWNSGYHEAFHTNFFIFSLWNSGHEAFHTNFFLFSRWNSGYHEAFSHELFFFHIMESWLSQSLFTNFSFT
jgi:hypothetical protein